MKKLIEFLKKDKTIGYLVLLILSLIFISIIALIIVLTFYKSSATKEQIEFFIGSIKDVFQIFFFLTIGLITFFSFRQAKKTLFTPIKTETFKMQIKAFEEILAFFQNKTETEFTHFFDFDNILKGNAHFLFTDFISHFFKKEVKIEKEKLKELSKEFTGGIATASWAEKNFVSPKYFDKQQAKKKEEIEVPAMILKAWNNYEYGPIKYTDTFSKEVENLNKLIASPLIPNDLKLLLEKFDNEVHNNLVLVGKVLNEIAQELPEKFPTSDSLDKFELAGVWNKYNKEKADLEPLALEILQFIRGYLKIDTLIE